MDQEKEEQFLQFLSSRFNINLALAHSEYDMKQNEKYLKQHPGKVWQGKDGKWYTYFGEGTENRKLVVRKTKAEMEAFIIDYYRTISETPTFDMLYHMWDKQRKENGELRPQSFDRYENWYKQFFVSNPSAKELLATKANVIDAEILDKCLYPSIKGLNLSAKDFANMCTIVRGTMKFAVQKRYTDFNIVNYMSCLNKPRNAFRRTKKTAEEQTFSDEEIKLMMQRWLDERDIRSLGLIILIESGLRVGELAALKKSDINLDTIYVQRTEIHYKDAETKKNKILVEDFTKTDAGTRHVVVGPVGTQILSELLTMDPECEWLFSERGKRVCESGFRKKLYSTCDSLHITKRSPHKLRKTYATQLIYAGVNEEVVKNQMGHTDISTTRRSYVYSRVDLNYVRAQLAKREKIG